MSKNISHNLLNNECVVYDLDLQQEFDIDVDA